MAGHANRSIRPSIIAFSPEANRRSRPIFDSGSDRSASNLATPIADRRPPAGSGARPCLLFFRFAFSAPISGAALSGPGRSVPIKRRHFYSGRRRFYRRPPFIGAAKRASRATRGGIGGACVRSPSRRESRPRGGLQSARTAEALTLHAAVPMASAAHATVQRKRE
jgi:hypothetical protein